MASNFDPFEAEASENNPLTDIDPDLNFFNDFSPSQSSYFSDIPPTLNFDMSLLHVNVRSLPKNNDTFMAYLESLAVKFDVIALSETWLSPENCHLPYISHQYNHIYNTRNHRAGGGVSLFIDKKYTFVQIADLTISNESMECIFTQINPLTPTTNPIVIGCVYRPPNTDIPTFLTHLTDILQHPKIQNKTCYILGDFNFNLLNHDSHSPTADFINTFFTANYIPLITKPTRITQHSSTLLDNIFTNSTNFHNTHSGILISDVTDHLPVFHLLNSSTSSHNKCAASHQPKPLINTRTLSNMNRSLLTTDWTTITTIEDPSQAYTQFIDAITEAYHEHIPLHLTHNKKSHKPWISRALLTSVKRKNKLYSIYLKHKTDRTLNYYKRYKNTLTKLIAAAKKQYYTNRIHSAQTNARKIWSTIKELITNNSQNPQTDHFVIDGQHVSNPTQIADAFNTFFTNIGPSLSSKIPHSDTDPLSLLQTNTTIPSIFFSPTSDQEITNIVNQLKPASPGYDMINTRILKHILPTITNPLTHIINISLLHGQVPDQLKIAKVVPIYKANDTTLVSNYRPISVLPIFSKIFEKVIATRLETHLTNNNILAPTQFGFRKHHSTQHAITIFTEKLYDSLNKHHTSIATFLDLSKAFDTINHSILLSKLAVYGIRGTPLQWFNSYLTNRKQYVTYKHTKSSTRSITCGVPQGSILGPILFILYINDLPKQSNILHYLLYADDTNLLITGKDLPNTIQILNNELNNIHTWLQVNKLSINLSKTNYMIFTNSKLPQHLPPIKINNTDITLVTRTKFLGITIDDKLNWKPHIALIKNKISKHIGIFYRLRHAVPKHILQTLYNSFILPHLSYGITSWGNTYPTHLKTLTTLQKKIIRLITFSHYRTHTPPLFKQLKILPLTSLYNYYLSLFAYKTTHLTVPTPIHEILTTRDNTHSYATRSTQHLPIFFHLHRISKMGVKYNLSRYYNNLPETIKHSTSYFVFKKKLKLFLLNQITSS